MMNAFKNRYCIGAFRKGTNTCLDITSYYDKKLLSENYLALCMNLILDSSKNLNNLNEIDFRIVNQPMRQINKSVCDIFDNAAFILLTKYDTQRITEITSINLHIAIKETCNYSNNNIFLNRFTKDDRIGFIASKIQATMNTLTNLPSDVKQALLLDLMECYEFTMKYALNNEYYESASNIKKFIEMIKSNGYISENL